MAEFINNVTHPSVTSRIVYDVIKVLPSNCCMRRIHGTSHHFSPNGMKFGNPVTKGKDLCWADIGEGQRIEEKDQIFAPRI